MAATIITYGDDKTREIIAFKDNHIQALQSNIEMLKFDMEAIRNRGLEYKRLYEEMQADREYDLTKEAQNG